MEYDYQHSIQSENRIIKNGTCKIEYSYPKNNIFVGYKLLSNDNISNSYYKIKPSPNTMNSIVEISLVYDELYLSSIESIDMDDVFYYPPCNCCVEEHTIPISGFDSDIEIIQRCKHSHSTVPTIMVYFNIPEHS